MSDLIDEAIDGDKGRLQRDTILKELREICLEAQILIEGIFMQGALKIKEMSFTDDEIDHFYKTIEEREK